MMRYRLTLFWFLAVLCAPAQESTDPRGPVVQAGIKPEVSSEGVYLAQHQFQPDRAAPPWQAPWIWLTPGTDAGGAIAASFRDTVSLPAPPRAVRARVSADIIYRLWVNGRLAARGPADPGNDYAPRSRWSHQWLYDVVDLAPFFRKGENVIAAEVFTKEQPNYSLGRPGFAFAAEFTFENHPALSVSTEHGWKATPASAYSSAQWKASEPTDQQVPYIRFDAAREPQGWRTAGYDDSGWPPAARIESVWGPLAQSEIPPRMEIVYPSSEVVRASEGAQIDGQSVTLKKDGSFAVRFDRVLSAYLSIRAEGPPGAVITLQPNEVNKPGFHRMTVVVLRQGTTLYEFPVMDSFSTVNVEVTNVAAPVRIEEVRASFVSYPVSYAGSFESSDPELNRLWKASRWATQICMQTHHLDSPHHQEPISDPGDYLIEALENYYAFGEPWLARQDLRKFGLLLKHSDYYNFHTSYSLLWLQMLMDYYSYTGDLALVRELAPAAHGLLSRFTGWRGKNGLISEAPNYMFMDWVEIAGIACHHPPAVIGQGYMTAFYYRGLADAARIAGLMGDTAKVRQYEQLRREVAAAFQRELWNPQRGLYRDGKPFQSSVPPSQWLPADTDIESFSPHVNTLAVLYDLAPAAAQRGIIEKVMAETPLNVQPYFMHFVFGALAHASLFDKYGVQAMRRWSINPESGTASEMWGTGDFSHGWTGSPLIQMSSRILGVTPAAAGFKTVAIRPLLSGLEWARGVAPTPHGRVEVSWKLTGSDISMRVSLPEGVTGEAYLPGFVGLRVNGSSVNRGPGGKLTLPTGKHEITGRMPHPV